MKKDNDDAAELCEEDGCRPTETVGPGECDASPIRCEEKASSGDEPHNCTFKADDELQESFPVEEIPVIEGEDGLPIIVTPPTESSEAVPFTYDTVICIEDDREYIEIFKEDITSETDSVILAVNEMRSSGKETPLRSRYDQKGKERKRHVFKLGDSDEFWGQKFGIKKMDGKMVFFPVKPIRERCQYYKRQVFSNDDQPDPTKFGHQIVFRLCEKRRSNGGAFMSLMNEGVYCCDFRNPPDEKSSSVQNKKDTDKLVTKPHELRVPMFGIVGDDIKLKDKDNG